MVNGLDKRFLNGPWLNQPWGSSGPSFVMRGGPGQESGHQGVKVALQPGQGLIQVRLTPIDGLFQEPGLLHQLPGAKTAGVAAQAMDPPGGGLPIPVPQPPAHLGAHLGETLLEAPEHFQEEAAVTTEDVGGHGAVETGDVRELLGVGRAKGQCA